VGDEGLEEEIGVKTEIDNLNEVGNIKFISGKDHDFNQHMHIFFIDKWQGDPQESEEMRPQWYKKDQIPYEEMWADDPYWLPKVLEGKKIEATCYFCDGGDEIEKFDMKEL